MSQTWFDRFKIKTGCLIILWWAESGDGLGCGDGPGVIRWVCLLGCFVLVINRVRLVFNT